MKRITIDLNNYIDLDLAPLVQSILFETKESANKILEANDSPYRVADIPNSYTMILEKLND